VKCACWNPGVLGHETSCSDYPYAAERRQALAAFDGKKSYAPDPKPVSKQKKGKRS